MDNNWIKAKRIALGLSQADLASIAKVSQSTIVRLEKGERLSTEYYIRVKEAINSMHYSMPSEEYLRTSIAKDAEELKKLEGKDAIDVLTHLIVHCSKLINELNK
jgi:DNA-binding XRE family transcriptional regulator